MSVYERISSVYLHRRLADIVKRLPRDTSVLVSDATIVSYTILNYLKQLGVYSCGIVELHNDYDNVWMGYPVILFDDYVNQADEHGETPL